MRSVVAQKDTIQYIRIQYSSYQKFEGLVDNNVGVD